MKMLLLYAQRCMSECRAPKVFVRQVAYLLAAWQQQQQ